MYAIASYVSNTEREAVLRLLLEPTTPTETSIIEGFKALYLSAPSMKSRKEFAETVNYHVNFLAHSEYINWIALRLSKILPHASEEHQELIISTFLGRLNSQADLSEVGTMELLKTAVPLASEAQCAAMFEDIMNADIIHLSAHLIRFLSDLAVYLSQLFANAQELIHWTNPTI